jgi:DNA-binding MarR family transcriptional regulator
MTRSQKSSACEGGGGSAAARLANLVGALAVGCAGLQVERMCQQTGLDEAALAALLAVDARPGCTVGDIAKTTGLSHSGAVRSIDRLAGRHLVSRAQRADDRRTVELCCTSTGTAVTYRALAARRQALTALIGEALPADTDRRSLERAVERLLRCLPKTDRADAWRICRLCEHAVCRGDNCPVGRSVP